MTRTPHALALAAALGLAAALPAPAQNIESPGAPNVFSPSDTVTVSSDNNADQFPPAALVDRTTAEFVFNGSEFAGITGFDSAISSLRFFDASNFGGRTAPGVSLYYSAGSTTSLDPAAYTSLGFFPLPVAPGTGYYTTDTSPPDTVGGSTLHYDTLSGLPIPAGTQSVLFSFYGGDTGDALSEIQAFAPAPEPSAWAGLTLGALGLGALALRARRRA